MLTNTLLPPILGFVSHKGTGKTTLLRKLLPLLCEQGICVGIIKNTHGSFEIDTPGSDSFELRKAGAQQVLVTSEQRWALMVERDYEHTPKIHEHLSHLETEHLDLVLIEGFAHDSYPKIELHRPTLNKPLLFIQDEHIIAVASDSPLILPDHIENLDLNNPKSILSFILSNIIHKQEQSA